MNIYSTSPDLALSMARYRSTDPADLAQARATIKAIRAEQRRDRNMWHPFTALARRFAVASPPARTANVH